MTGPVSIESAVVQSPDFRSRTLDEDVWNAWIQKSIALEHARAASRTRTVKWICIGVLTGAAVFSHSFFTTADSGYQMSVRFVISLGGLAGLLQSLRARQYAFTALFALLMVMFNPLLPTFDFSGKWVILVASLFPFIASLIFVKEESPSSPANPPSKIAI